MKKDKVDWIEAYALYTAGDTYATIGRKIGRSPMVVWCKFRDLGLATRGKFHSPAILAPSAYKLANPQNEEDAYWLGYLFADGCLTTYLRKDNTRVGILCLVSGLKDLEQMHKFSTYVEGYVHTYDDHVSVVAKRSPDWCELEKLGFGDGKTFRLSMPKLQPQLIHHFIRGFFDGDGWATQDRHQRLPLGKAGFTCATLSFLEELQLILTSMHIASTIQIGAAVGSRYSIKGKVGVRKNNTWQLVIRKIESFNSFHDYLYTNATLYLSRKKDKFAEVIQYRANDCLNKQSLCNA